MDIKMNLPFQKIHDPEYSYGHLLFPFFGKWIAYFEKHGFKLTSHHGFHNCTRTGIY